MDFHNAELALKRARSDLATQVRTAYFNLVVAKETVRVNRALARFTDEIYRYWADNLAASFAASHEPAALRAQAFTIRLAYKQAIANYVYAWKQLVAAIGLPQLPLTAVDGQVDRLVPYYEYDAVLAQVLRRHTDVLTANNTLEKARYNLRLAQITPVPDVEVRADLWKEFTVQPFNTFHSVSVSVPLPIWDQNKGNIRAAAAGLYRATEGPHQVELSITTGLATAYSSYLDNLYAMEDYRRHILPDLVRYYRGVLDRRQADPAASFGDIVAAQQNLTANAATYLGVLGNLWTSVVTVADFLQTDDLYQVGKPLELPHLPDFDQLHAWPCPHPQPPPPTVQPGASPLYGTQGPTAKAPASSSLTGSLPPSTGQQSEPPARLAVVSPPTPGSRREESAGDPARREPVPELPSDAPTSVAVPPAR
jgi:cobalt-zinc-cadmium efflux system outer membrane protein